METDAPTAARKQDLQSCRALTLFFRWRKKSVQKKASGTATPGKRLLLPILTAGLAMSRAMESGSLPIRAERARARLFPPSKWAGLFPSAAYRRPAPAQLAGDILNPCRVGCFGVACVFCHAKGQREIKSTLAFSASHEARRRMAVWTRQQTGSRARPASREALRRAAVKPRPSSMSPYAPARTARSLGSRSTAPCASHEARRRMAVFAMQLAGICTRPASRGTCRATVVKPQPTCMSLYAPARPWRAVRG